MIKKKKKNSTWRQHDVDPKIPQRPQSEKSFSISLSFINNCPPIHSLFLFRSSFSFIIVKRVISEIVGFVPHIYWPVTCSGWMGRVLFCNNFFISASSEQKGLFSFPHSKLAFSGQMKIPIHMTAYRIWWKMIHKNSFGLIFCLGMSLLLF